MEADWGEGVLKGAVPFNKLTCGYKLVPSATRNILPNCKSRIEENRLL